MSEPSELPDSDLDTQLRGLFQEAEQKIQGRQSPPAAPAPAAVVEKEGARQTEERAIKGYLSLPQMLRPMVLGLEAISRATGENAVILQKLDKVAGDAASAQKSLPQLLAGFECLLEQKNGVNQRMFDALHEELKDYKDGFLLESVLKPIIRDLVSLYDELSTIHQQMRDCVAESDGLRGPAGDRLKTMEMNLAHHCEFVIEILARLEVLPMPGTLGKLDKHTQRAVAVEPAEHPDQDMHVVRTVKSGFIWKSRVLRAEEVVVRRWKQSTLHVVQPVRTVPALQK